MTTAIESQYHFTAEIQSKGKQQNRDGWAMTVGWRLPGSIYDLILYGQDWDTVRGHEVGNSATIVINQGNLKKDKDGRYASDYFWDMVSIDLAVVIGEIVDIPVQAPPKPDPTPKPTTRTGAADEEPPPNPAALGACHNHAVDFITSGILPLPEGRELVGWVRELRDRFYREINQAPVMPLHYCYEHGEKRRQGRTQQWGHILPKQSDGDEDSYCMETREGWRVGTE
jgi:hypothetical protein